MSATGPSYAVVTPARDEAQHLPRLADCLARQSQRPLAWVVVDDGSTDSTAQLVASLAAAHGWVRLVPREAPAAGERGAPIVRAFHHGLEEATRHGPDVVVKLDADLSFGEGYFEALVSRFAADERLGIASGVCLERDAHGRWRRRFGTGTGVWGACRAYRSDCLREILPLEERQGWDEIDALKAVVRGWRTTAFDDLPFHHHRREGERDGSQLKVWAAQGEVAHYIGYRPSYVLLRGLFRAAREPAALALLAGYAAAAARRAPRLDDAAAVAYLRSSQRLRHLRSRATEAMGLRAVAIPR